MTTLSFSAEGNNYVAKFIATAPFAIEVKNGGKNVRVAINYVGANDKYAEVVGSAADGDIYVRNFGGGSDVYPVYVKVICSANPSYGGYAIAE